MAILNKIELSEGQKEFITSGIIKGTIELMTNTIKENYKKRARRFTKPHQQSKTAITKDTIQYNLFTDNQKLPARPRDFRLNISSEEKNIGMSELTDILSNPIIKNLLNKKNEKFPYKRGRPDSSLAEERRGRHSYREKSDLSEILDMILKDSKCLEKIDSKVTCNEIFPNYLKYAYNVKNEENRLNKKAFQNSYKPIRENEKSDFSIKKSNNDNIILDRQELNILYRAGALIFFNSLSLSQSS